MKTSVALAVGRITEALDSLTEEERKEVLAEVLKNRCRQCFDYNPSGQFWCCYDSRGDYE